MNTLNNVHIPLFKFYVPLYKSFLSIWFHYLYSFITQTINKIKKIFFITVAKLHHTKGHIIYMKYVLT